MWRYRNQLRPILQYQDNREEVRIGVDVETFLGQETGNTVSSDVVPPGPRSPRREWVGRDEDLFVTVQVVRDDHNSVLTYRTLFLVYRGHFPTFTWQLLVKGHSRYPGSFLVPVTRVPETLCRYFQVKYTSWWDLYRYFLGTGESPSPPRLMKGTIPR